MPIAAVEPQTNTLAVQYMMYTFAGKTTLMYALKCQGNSAISHICHIVKKFPPVGNELSVLHIEVLKGHMIEYTPVELESTL